MRVAVVIVLVALAMAAAKPVSDAAPADVAAASEHSRPPLDASTAPAAAPAAAPEEDEGEGEGVGEVMEGAETVVFRPLFVHRQRQARRRPRSPYYYLSPAPSPRYRPFRPRGPRPAYARPQRERPPLQVLY